MILLTFGDIGTISQTVNKDEDGIKKAILIKGILLDSIGRIILEGKDKTTPRGMPSEILISPKSSIKSEKIDEIETSDGYIELFEYDDDDGKPYLFFTIGLFLDDKVFSEFWERFSRVRDLDNISISIKGKNGISRLSASESLTMKIYESFDIKNYTFQFIQRKQDT